MRDPKMRRYIKAIHERKEAWDRSILLHSPVTDQSNNHTSPENICMPVETNGELGCSARRVYREPAPKQPTPEGPLPQGANSMLAPKKPRMSPAPTIHEGRLPPSHAIEQHDKNSGSVAIKSAVIPDDNDSSAQTTPPLPRSNPSSNAAQPS